jgi:hypothetical protein
MLARFLDQSTTAVFSILIFALVVLALSVPPASASQSGTPVYGCSMAQLQTPQAGKCLKKLDDDIMHDRPTQHFAHCTGVGTIRCCEHDAQTGAVKPHSCELMTISRPNPALFPNASLSSTGGIEAQPGGGPASGGGTSNVITTITLRPAGGSGPLL